MDMNKTDLQHLAAGVAFLGGGGGGTLRAGLEMIKENWKSDEPVKLVSVDEIRDDDKDLTVACGFLAAQDAVEDATNFEDLRVVLEAFRKIAETEGLGRIARLVPIELGVQSCVLPICLTAKALNSSGNGWDLSVLDADGAGRAVPMISATTLASASVDEKVKLFPAVFGGMIPDDPRTGVSGGRVWMRFEGQDSTGYHLHTSATGSLVGFVDSAAALVCWPMKSKSEVASALPPGVRGTLSLSRDLGRIFSEKSANPVQAGMDFLNSKGRNTFHIFQGTIKSVSKDQSRVKLINGKDSLIVLSSGENMAAIRAGKVRAMAPDSICYVTQDGTAFSSAEVNELLKEKGKSITVHVVGIPAREEIRKSELAKVVFGVFRGNSLRHEKVRRDSELPAVRAGVDVNEFSPIELLNASSSKAYAV